MVLRKFLKIGIAIIFIFLILISGLIMLQKLNHDKQVFGQDLHAYIPSDVSGVFQINRAKDMKLYSKYFPEIENILLSINSSVTFPVLVTSSFNHHYFFAKVTVEQEQVIAKILSESLFTAFQPKVRIYNGAKIYFYPSVGNRFFACLFYNGIFVGGYDYELLERIVDAAPDKMLFANDTLKSLQSELKTSYSANLIFKEDAGFSVYNASFGKNGQLELSGYERSLSSCQTSYSDSQSDTVSLDYSILSDSLLSYQIDLSGCMLSEEFKPYFDNTTYCFELDTLQSAPIYLMKYNKDRFEIFDKLNSLEKKYIGRRLNTKDIVLTKQHVYTSSEQLASSVFQQNAPVTISFYEGYLIYTKDRNALIRYLTFRESNRLKGEQSEFADTLQLPVKSLFVSRNIQKSKKIPFNSFITGCFSSFRTVSIKKYYLQPGLLKTEIILNN